MHIESDQRLWDDLLWCALANAIMKLNTEGTDTLRRWTQDSASIELVNQLAKKAGLSNLAVIEIEFEKALLEPDGWKHPDRWRIGINHPRPLDPIVIYLGKFPLKQAQAALPEIAKYLVAWQGARAEQLSKQRPAKVKPTGKWHPPRRVGIRGLTAKQKKAMDLKELRFTHAQIADEMGLKNDSSVTALLERGEAAKQRIADEGRRERSSEHSIRANVSLDAREGSESDN